MIISEMEEANKNLKEAKNIAIEALQTAENANKAKTDFYPICRMIFAYL